MAQDIRQEIAHLKKDRKALILAHYYEVPEVQDIADEIGDSLFLAQRGQASSAEVILLAGVTFMAESVKILSPQKIVLVPDLKAGCSLVDSSPIQTYGKWKESFPKSVLVTYINSSAEVKAISDVICTSSNAEKIIRSIPADRTVLFGPDRNLGSYLATKTGRAMQIWPGSCEVHVLFSAEKLRALVKIHPEAVILAHPECEDAVLLYASVIGSTSRLLEEVQKNPAKKFIVATEDGILHQMQKSRPDALLMQAPTHSAEHNTADGTCGCNRCPYMKLNTLEKIRDALRDLKPQVHVSPAVAQKAQVSLQKMLDISAGKSVSW